MNNQEIFNKITFFLKNKSQSFLKIFTSNFQKRWKFILISYIFLLFFAFLFNNNNNYPIKIYFLLAVGITILLLLIGKKMHFNAFLIIILFGTFFCFLTPIGDVPDEGTHLARSLFIVNGNLGMEDNSDELKISKDFEAYSTQMGKNFYNSDLKSYFHSNDVMTQITIKAANAYSFLSYIPQVIGLFIGKIFNLSLFSTYYLGRFMNLLVYAIIVAVAVKIAPEFKLFVTFISIMPMSVYISSSYNQDSFALGIIIFTFSLFLKMLLGKNNIFIKDIIIYSLFCMILALSKLPYVLFILLPLSIPSSKFKKNTYKWFTFFMVLVVGVLALIWFLYYSSFKPPHTPQGVNSKEQIIYILTNVSTSYENLLKSMMTFANSSLMLFIFGWGSYGSSELAIVYFFVLGSLVLSFPKKYCIPRSVSVGTGFVFALIYIAICLSMYLTWTPVGSEVISGIQGRYFIGIILLLPVFLNMVTFKQKLKSSCINLEGVNFTYIYIGIIFLLAVECLTLGVYY